VSAPRPSLAGLHGLAQKRPLYSRLPALYFATPAWVKRAARSAFAARQGRIEGLVRRYLAFLEDAPAGDGRPVPLLLTHDVDTAEGLAALPRLLAVEEALGLASLVFLVTHRYAWDRAALAGLAERGHAFGVHDTTHDNRLAYLPAAAVEARIARAQQALGALDSGAFRAPAFLRSRALYEGIHRRVRVDLSTNDSALVWPHPGDGLGSPFPVRYRGLVCAPTTLPRDGELIALGLEGQAALDLCVRKAEQLARAGAPAVVLTHPDPTFTDTAGRRETYGRLLERLRASGRFQLAAPARTLAELARRATGELAA
jgi:peptidoglycan/xylan/chitin deacetylase (PgdA/CDA1 family)